MHVKLISWYITTQFQLRQLISKWLHTGLKKPLAHTLVYFGILLRTLGNNTAGLNLVLKGRRVDYVARANSIIGKIICSSDQRKTEFNELLPKGSALPIKAVADRILILKLPKFSGKNVIEKGAIIIKFSETFAPIYQSLNVQLLSKYFRIVLEPSSSGYSAEEILVWTTLSPEKVVVLAPDAGDFRFLSDLNSNLIPVVLGASDWVNPTIFRKVNDVQKIYDAIYVANFNPVKRVDRYIRAVAQINRKNHNFQAALVCAGFGSSQRAIMTMLESVSNSSNITLFHAMPQSELNQLFNQSKVNVLLSLKEGANKGLSEGLFAGTPALLLAENVGVNRAIVNAQTGRVVSDANLEESLMWFSKHYHDFEPAEWALKHISPTTSTQKLSKILKEIELSEGRQWTIDLMPKVNQPELAYLNPEDQWLLSKRAALLEEFSIGGNVESIASFLEQLNESHV